MDAGMDSSLLPLRPGLHSALKAAGAKTARHADLLVRSRRSRQGMMVR